LSSVNRLELTISGMTCATCVGRVERALTRHAGVQNAIVNLATETALVTFRAAEVSPDELLQVIGRAGFGADVAKAKEEGVTEARARANRSLRLDLAIAAGFSLPLLLLSMGPMVSERAMALQMQIAPMQIWHWGLWALATPVQFLPGMRFVAAGIKAVRAKSPDMNTLVMLGSLSSYLYSALVTSVPKLFPIDARHVYFESGAVVITLVLLGKFLESRAKHQAGQAVQRLLEQVPKRARLRRDGQLVEVASESIRVGDVLVVGPGEKIAADGEIISGSSYVDESMVTGESMPNRKEVGANVVVGTLNQLGSIDVRVTAVGSQSTLAQIVALVERAQASKPAIQQASDGVVARFVPVVLAVGLLTTLVWLAVGSVAEALTHAVAVLIVACPCAVGLAIPTSMLVGTGRAAEAGLLFRKTEALQQLAATGVVAFDKTGTLTRGKPEVVTCTVVSGWDENAAIRLAASAESTSEHPLAQAFSRAAKERALALLKPSSFDAAPGKGVHAIVEGQAIVLGSFVFLQECGVRVRAPETLALGEHTLVFLAVDGVMAAGFGIADSVRVEAREALTALRSLGLSLVMVSGDHEASAQRVAAELGIDKVFARTLPEQKSEVVRALQNGKRQKVVFVGDGINDAPALAEANVGIAIGAGTDVALETADVVLMASDLRGVARAIVLARAVMRNIHINLFWAFAYNLALVPLAAGVFTKWPGWSLNPMLAGGAMACSSLFVVGNALRLRNIKFSST
jgi:P-type Cu+ transporter